MVNYTKHQHISTSSATTSTLGLVDGTDKIHTGIIKALELAAAGTAVLEYGGSVFQQTAGSTRTQFGVSGAIQYMREGLVLSSTPTAVELTADPDVTNDRYDMIVIQSSDNNFAPDCLILSPPKALISNLIFLFSALSFKAFINKLPCKSPDTSPVLINNLMIY